MSSRLILVFGGYLIIFYLVSCNSGSTQNRSDSDSQFTNLDKTNHHSIDLKVTEYLVQSSIRALEVIDENHVWFAGNNATFGYTKDGGKSWEIDSITDPVPNLEFRSIAVVGNAVFLLNVGSPAYLLRSLDQGASWEIVYQEDHPDVFYDSMKFWDNMNGIAMGDPTDGCLSVIITRNGGSSWTKLDCGILPPIQKGEAAFAASNSNIALYEQHGWLVTGGTQARVFHTPDMGRSWNVYETPIIKGGKMTGIFTVDFYDSKLGVIFGGDWENKSTNKSNKAVTRDGGKTWELISDGQGPGYRSCVQFVPGSAGQKLVAVGSSGISSTKDGGKSWQNFNQEGYYTIRFAAETDIAWLAGKNKIGKWVNHN